MLNEIKELNNKALPIAIIGAGPIGLAAASQIIERGETPIIIETGATAGASVLKWGHVRMFSPWKYNTDKSAVKLLQLTGWQEPDGEQLPTGRELYEEYLKPLSELEQISTKLHLNTRVQSVTRLGYDKMKSGDRDSVPFVLHIQNSVTGQEERIIARGVIDASGTYEKPNPAGAGGYFASGEKLLSDNIFYGIPDVLGQDRQRYAGKRIIVIGSGHSAVNALLDLGKLIESEPTTKVTWVVRRANTKTLFGGGEADELAARGMLGTNVRALVESGKVKLVSNFSVINISQNEEGIIVQSETETLLASDEIIVATGFRPDLEILGELRLGLDQIVESPTTLAPLIDPNLHSCGTVYPHGAEELKHPEKDFYIVGMKSYGRAPTFLLMTGYEQVRSVVAALAGDWEAARQVELVLPETGVCKTDDDGGECCGGPGVPVTAPVIIGISRNKNKVIETAAETATGKTCS